MTNFVRREQTTRVVELALPTPINQAQLAEALGAAHTELGSRASADDAAVLDLVDGELVLRFTVIESAGAPVDRATPEADQAAPVAAPVEPQDDQVDEPAAVQDEQPIDEQPAEEPPAPTTPAPAADAGPGDDLDQLIHTIEDPERAEASAVPEEFLPHNGDDQSAIASSLTAADEEDDDELVFTVRTGGADTDDTDETDETDVGEAAPADQGTTEPAPEPAATEQPAPTSGSIPAIKPAWTQHLGAGNE